MLQDRTGLKPSPDFSDGNTCFPKHDIKELLVPENQNETGCYLPVCTQGCYNKRCTGITTLVFTYKSIRANCWQFV